MVLRELFAAPRDESLPKKLFFDEVVSSFVHALTPLLLSRRYGGLGVRGVLRGVFSFEWLGTIFRPEASRRLIPMLVVIEEGPLRGSNQRRKTNDV